MLLLLCWIPLALGDGDLVFSSWDVCLSAYILVLASLNLYNRVLLLFLLLLYSSSISMIGACESLKARVHQHRW